MTNLEWAKAFVGCKLPGTGKRFQETVDVLVERLEARDQAAAEGMREKCARVCDGAISKGGMRNQLAMKIRELSLSGPSVLELAKAKARLEEAQRWNSHIVFHYGLQTDLTRPDYRIGELRAEITRLEKEGNRD